MKHNPNNNLKPKTPKDIIPAMLVISSCFQHHISQFLLLFRFLISIWLIRIDLVRIRTPQVRNQTIPALRSMEKGNKASSFWNEGIPDPDQIGFSDGWSSACAIETGWTKSGTAGAIHDSQAKNSICKIKYIALDILKLKIIFKASRDHLVLFMCYSSLKFTFSSSSWGAITLISIVGKILIGDYIWDRLKISNIFFINTGLFCNYHTQM